jgi:hypothetical protein
VGEVWNGDVVPVEGAPLSTASVFFERRDPRVVQEGRKIGPVSISISGRKYPTPGPLGSWGSAIGRSLGSLIIPPATCTSSSSEMIRMLPKWLLVARYIAAPFEKSEAVEG